MNKKAIAYSTIMKIPDLIFLVIAFSLIAFLLAMHIKVSVETFPVESDINAIRLLYNELAYEDPDTGRIYPGTIDLEKLNSDYITQVHDQSKNYMPTKISFQNQEIYIDKDAFNDNYAARFVTGRGRINKKEINLFTLTKNPEQEGFIEIILTQKAR